MTEPAVNVAPAVTAEPVAMSDVPATADAVTPSPAASSSVAAAAAAPVVPRARPHPDSYYEVPSCTENAVLPKYTDAELAVLATLPDDSAVYVPVMKRYLVNPFMKPKQLPAASPPAADSGMPASSPEPASAAATTAASEESEPAAKRARTEPPADGNSSAPPSSSCRVHEHGAGGDEFDAEEAAGAKEHVRTSEQADAASGATPAAPASSSSSSDSVAAATASIVATTTAALADNAREKRKRGRGQNKNNEREFFNAKDSIEGRICKSLVQGKPCMFGEKCRYSHDMDAYRAATAASAFPGACPLFSRYGVCAAGQGCKWASEGHSDQFRPANPQPLAPEMNILPREVGQELRSTPLDGPKYEKTFPRTAALTKRYEIWRRLVEKMRNQRQAEKEAAQRAQIAEAKAKAKAAQLALEEAAANAVATGTPMPAMPAAEAAGPAFSAATPASGAAAATSGISASFLPPSFPSLTAEAEIEIAALKANYSSDIPHKVDPFQIVSEAHSDWSSGCILIDLERKAFDFKDKLYLAPLTTVGNLPFRRVCRAFGADAMSNSLGKGAANEWALLRRHPDEKHFGVQIAGSHPDQVSRACEIIAKTCQVDFVDLNIGCPIDQVTDKGMGSAMMQRKRMKNLEPIMRSMRSMLDCSATIKMRMGWSTTELTAMELLPLVNRCGMAAVTIHGRTRQQRYTKTANMDFIKQAATFAKTKLNGLPVIANGDIYGFEDYEAVVNSESDVTTVMIARGALVKPWIFTEIKERRVWDISASERLDMLRQYVQFGHEHFGTDTKGVESTRRYLLEMLSFTHRYVPVGLLERPRVHIQQKSPPFYARSDLEQLLASSECKDWIRISEMLIGPVPDNYRFTPKHKSATQSEEGNG